MSDDQEIQTLFPLEETEKRSKGRNQPRPRSPDQLSTQLIFTGEAWEEIKVWDSLWFAKAQEMKVRLESSEDKTQGRKSLAKWRHALDVYYLAASGLTQPKIAEALDLPVRSLKRILSPDRDQKPRSAYRRALAGLIYEGYHRGLKLRPFYESTIELRSSWIELREQMMSCGVTDQDGVTYVSSDMIPDELEDEYIKVTEQLKRDASSFLPVVPK